MLTLREERRAMQTMNQHPAAGFWIISWCTLLTLPPSQGRDATLTVRLKGRSQLVASRLVASACFCRYKGEKGSVVEGSA